MTHEQIPPTKFPLSSAEDFPGPAKRFDCLEALKPHIGNALWRVVITQLTEMECTVCTRRHLGEEYGVTGFPVEVLHDHVFGQGTFTRKFPVDEERHMKQAYEAGKAAGSFVKGLGLPVSAEVIMMADGDPFYPDDFRAGMEDASGMRTREEKL
jgi:hypothetical protein